MCSSASAKGARFRLVEYLQRTYHLRRNSVEGTDVHCGTDRGYRSLGLARLATRSLLRLSAKELGCQSHARKCSTLRDGPGLQFII